MKTKLGKDLVVGDVIQFPHYSGFVIRTLTLAENGAVIAQPMCRYTYNTQTSNITLRADQLYTVVETQVLPESEEELQELEAEINSPDETTAETPETAEEPATESALVDLDGDGTPDAELKPLSPAERIAAAKKKSKK